VSDGAALQTLRGSLQCSPDLTGFKEPTSKGRGGKRRKGRGVLYVFSHAQVGTNERLDVLGLLVLMIRLTA